MLPLRLILDSKIISEFTCQAIGLVLAATGFILGAIALKYSQIWLIYLGIE